MPRQFKKIVKSSLVELDSDQIKAAGSLGKKITGVWKADGFMVIQMDSQDSVLHYWENNEWVKFSPISIRSTDALSPADGA